MTRLHIRLIGMVSILTGLCVFAGGTIHIGLQQPWGHWLMVLGGILQVFAFTGLYAVQSRQAGILGMIAYILIILGSMVTTAANIVVLPDIYGLKSAHEVWMFLYIDLSLILPMLFALLTGMLLFGLVTVYTRVLPRWAGLLLALAAIIDLPAELLSGFTFLYLIALGLFLISMGWMGASLLKPQAVSLQANQPQTGLSQVS